MRPSDIVLLVCLLVFLGLTLLPRSRQRTVLMWAVLLGAGGLGVWLAALGRWQAWAAVGIVVVTGLILLGVQIFGGTKNQKRLFWVGGILRVTYLGVVGAAGFLLWCFPATDLPRPAGPNAVGTASFDLVDHNRIDKFAPEGGSRRVHVQAWYPAIIAAGSKPKPYFTKAEAEAMAEPFAIQFGQPKHTWTHLRLVGTNSHPNAAIQAELGKLPIIIFNHGYWSLQMQNTVLMEDLASRGYLVLSLAHPYDSAAVLFNDGDVIRVDSSETMKIIVESEGLPELETYLGSMDPGMRYQALMALKAKDLDNLRMFASSKVWRDDIAFVLDSIANGQVGGAVKQIVDQGDYARLGLVGMSFGGSTTAGFCLRDARCKAGVNLDAMAWDQAQYNATIPAPFMVLLGDPRANRPNADINFARTDYMYETVRDAGLLPDKYRFLIAGSTHPDFTDFTDLLRGPARKKIMRLGTISGQRMLAATNRLVSDFFETYVRGQDVDFPAAALTASPEAQKHDVSYVRLWAEKNGVE